MQEEGKKVGVFKMPAFGDGAWAKSLVEHRQRLPGAQSSSEQQEVAGAFLAFLQQPENLAKLYAATGTSRRAPTGTRRSVTSPTDQQMLDWLGEKSDVWWAANYTPVDLDVNGTFVMWQKMMAGEIDVDGAVEDVPGRARHLGRRQPAALENYKTWLAG